MAAGSREKGGGPLFWADQTAREIMTRRKCRYVRGDIPRTGKFTVKTSASVSGVLHIGRLSDTIRGDEVVRALRDAGAKADLIWVAEDMDPLRSIPKGVPKDFSRYIGMPVTDVPDPDGCHGSYAEHHTERYFEVLHDFVSVKMKRFSTREEYRKGSFRPFIEKIMENAGLVREIQDRYRSSPLPAGWSPWKPVCESCGKIITTRVTGTDGRKVLYRCGDYSFEKAKAEGCGHEGENDPLKGNGKLVWKSEWAAEWALWKVSAEGAGKEYQVPNSAWWVNGEIAEKVLGFPMPVPIFYEHVMIDGEKMSASMGNVVYPSDWLEVATPELLRFFYGKKLMKTRSFSWSDLPRMYDDYDSHESAYFGGGAGKGKETEHMKRLYAISQKKVPRKAPARVPFDLAVSIAQIARGRDMVSRGIGMLRKTGHVRGKLSAAGRASIGGRLRLAGSWAEKHAPERYRFRLLDRPARRPGPASAGAIAELSSRLKEREWDEEGLEKLLYDLCRKHGVGTKAFFRDAYMMLIGKEYGPRLAPFILSIGREKVSRLLGGG